MGPTARGPIKDSEIIQKILSGQREAYADLVLKYQVRVLQLCTSLLPNPADAEDAAQEIFLKAYRSLDQFRGAAAFSTWIYRIATNHCLDLLREQSRHRTESWEELVTREGERLNRLLSAPTNPVLRLEEADLIEQVLSCLPPEHRIVLILREVQGLSYQEIAEVLNCSLESIRARLRRARQSFEEKLRHFLRSGDV